VVGLNKQRMALSSSQTEIVGSNLGLFAFHVMPRDGRGLATGRLCTQVTPALILERIYETYTTEEFKARVGLRYYCQ